MTLKPKLNLESLTCRSMDGFLLGGRGLLCAATTWFSRTGGPPSATTVSGGGGDGSAVLMTSLRETAVLVTSFLATAVLISSRAFVSLVGSGISGMMFGGDQEGGFLAVDNAGDAGGGKPNRRSF